MTDVPEEWFSKYASLVVEYGELSPSDKLRAALSGYNAQYGVKGIGEQNSLPSGAVSRVEAVVRAANEAVAEMSRLEEVINHLMPYAQKGGHKLTSCPPNSRAMCEYLQMHDDGSGVTRMTEE